MTPETKARIENLEEKLKQLADIQVKTIEKLQEINSKLNRVAEVSLSSVPDYERDKHYIQNGS